MDKISYHPASFSGEYHYITMRKAKVQENGDYRNLAHALFAARNVIDGIVANESHWPWPYQSWGID